MQSIGTCHTNVEEIMITLSFGSGNWGCVSNWQTSDVLMVTLACSKTEQVVNNIM